MDSEGSQIDLKNINVNIDDGSSHIDQKWF